MPRSMHVRGAKRQVALTGVLLLALLLRVWRLDSVPPGPDSDEVAIGYNAYSILRTGRDEYGASWPVLFRSYGDYKRPLYIYATVPSVALLGLTPISIRLPAALAGTAAVGMTY